MPYTSPFNLTKNPSCSIPCGFVDGLPVGLQVTGPLFGDLAVLQACHAYETAACPAWPSPELTSSLDKIARSAEAGVSTKRWTNRQ
jgi:aspartyl-tRNA(Asn)/glutamyl-tRNA(Gln) amidotransferase subunit A